MLYSRITFLLCKTKIKKVFIYVFFFFIGPIYCFRKSSPLWSWVFPLSLLVGYLAYEFDKFWLEEEPESIMEFNRYREKFHDKVKGQLQVPEVTLIMTVGPEKWLQHSSIISKTMGNRYSWFCFLFPLIVFSWEMYNVHETLFEYKSLNYNCIKCTSRVHSWLFSYIYPVREKTYTVKYY